MDVSQRKQFADFLDRFASQAEFDRDDWERYVVAHYPDTFLEEIRRCVVRLGMGKIPVDMDSDEGRQLLRAWAVAVRYSFLPEE